MARIRTLFVVALSAVTLLVVGLPSAQARVVFDKVFVKPSVAAMYPSGLEWDSANDRIVVADTGRNRILFYSITGNRQGAFGRHGTGPGQFDTPRDVAIDDRGRIYVADAANHRIQAFTANGMFRWQRGGTGSGNNNLNTPIGVTWDSRNDVLLVASTGQDLIKAFDAGGSFEWKSDPGSQVGIDAPRDVARGPDNRIWIADYAHHQVKAFDVNPAGVWDDNNPDVTIGTGMTGDQDDRLWFPYNVDFSPDGDTAYISSTGNGEVRAWNISGTALLNSIGTKCQTLVCNPQQPPDDKIEDLRRVVVSDSGRLITADFWGNGLKVFNASGNPVRDIEGESARRRGVAEAFGVDVGANGTVYAVDRLNQQVEWYSANGTFRGTAHSRNDVSWPESIAAGDDGVWVADTRGGTIQLSSPDLNDTSPTVVDLGVTGYIHDLDVASNGDVFVVVGLPGPEKSLYQVDGTTHAFQTIGPGFSDPQGVAVNNKFIFVADAGANEIVRIQRSNSDVTRSSIRLHGPHGVAVAPNGHVWVADTNANTIVHLRANLSLVERHKPRGSKALDLPHTLAVSPDGDWLFVADTFNNRVLRFRI